MIVRLNPILNKLMQQGVLGMKHMYLLSALMMTLVGCASCKTSKGLQPGQEAISESNPAGESTARTPDDEDPKKTPSPSL